MGDVTGAITSVSVPPNEYAVEKGFSLDVRVTGGSVGGGSGGGGLAENLWTDNTGNYFVRVETSAGVVAWEHMDGTASSAPGAGAKPAGGTDSAILAALNDPTNSPVMDGGSAYALIAVSSAAVAVGDANDCLVSVRWQAGATPTDIVIKDGTTVIATIKAAVQVASTEGTEYFGLVAVTDWKITTGTGSAALCAFNARP